MHTLVSLDTFKGQGIANLEKDGNDERILQMLEAVALDVTGWLQRLPYPTIKTVYFSGNGGKVLEVPDWDIISVTTLKEDNDRDAVYEVTWAATDYILAPYSHDPTDLVNPRPYWKLEVDERDTGNQDAFLRGQQMYELIGKFGFCELVVATGAVINEGGTYTAVDTTLTVDTGSLVHVGDTLVIESEYLYVSGQDVSESNDFTVVRGMHGSTAASHADATAISRWVYPQPIVEAAIVIASNRWTRRTSGFTDRTSFEGGVISTTPLGFDSDVLRMLDPYKRRLVA